MQLPNENLIVVLLFIFYSAHTISADNTTEKFEIVVPEKPPTPAENKTIDKLVQEQTDLIKKIVSSHKATTIDYPIVTRKEAEIKVDPKTKAEKERQSIEELRRKCHEFFKFNNYNNTQKITERSETKEQISTVEAFGPTRKPEFLQKPKLETLQAPTLPPNFSYPSQVEQIPKRYFIITRNQSNTTPKPQNLISQTQIIQNPLQQNIKYVQLEPIILQKLILSNGRMLYYWHRNIPIIPQYVQIPKYQTQTLRGSDIDPNFKYPSQVANSYQIQASGSQTNPYQTSTVQTYPYQFQTHPPYQVQASNVETQAPNVQEHSYQAHGSSIQTQPSETSYFQANAQILNSSQIQSSHPVQPVQEVVPKYEIEYSTTEKSEDDNFKKQMKFVIPVPYPASERIEAPGRYPWQFDPYAYYPRSLQPSTINVPLPYLPTFHMIRTLRIPDHLLKSAKNHENN